MSHRPQIFLLSHGLALVALVACSTTPLEVIDVGDAGIGTPEAGSSGAGGTLGTDSGVPPCEVNGEPNHFLIRLRNTEVCLVQGSATSIGMTTAYWVTTGSCQMVPEAEWALNPDDGAFELRHVGTNMNLDMLRASTTDGTPAVLYRPHELYNQRFFLEDLTDGSQTITPRNALGKCLSRQEGFVQLWPCDASDLSQHWETVAVACD